MHPALIAILVIFVIILICKALVIVPQKSAYIVERLGKYRMTLEAGFHIIIPFIDRLAYRLSMKEMASTFPRSSASRKTTSWLTSTAFCIFR